MSLSVIEIELSFGTFRTSITVDAESADVRPPERGDLYAELGGPLLLPVDNTEVTTPTAYTHADDRVYEAPYGACALCGHSL